MVMTAAKSMADIPPGPPLPGHPAIPESAGPDICSSGDGQERAMRWFPSC